MLRAPLGLLAPPHCYTLKEADVRGQPRLSLLKESDDTSIMQLLRMHGSELLAPMARGVEVSSLSIQLALAAKGVGVAVLSALGASHPSAQAMSSFRCSRWCSESCSSCAAGTGRPVRHGVLLKKWCGGLCRRPGYTLPSSWMRRLPR